MRAVFLLLCLTLWSTDYAIAASKPVPGFVAVISRDESGAIQLVRLTEIQHAPRERGASDTRNWGVLLYNASGRVVWKTHIVNPLNTAGRVIKAGTPIAGLTFANLPGAVRAELRDANGDVVFQVELGSLARATAHRNGEQLRQRMLDTIARTPALSRGSSDGDDALARASALKQVDYNARERDRLPKCNAVAPVIPEEANRRALTRSPDCTESDGALAADDAVRSSNAALPPRSSRAAASNSPEGRMGNEPVQTSELDLVNATFIFQGSAGEAISDPLPVVRFLSNGETQQFTTDATGSVTITVERSKPMQLFVGSPPPWLWGWFSPPPIAQDSDFTLVTRLVRSVPLHVKLAVPPGEEGAAPQFNVSIDNGGCCGHASSLGGTLQYPVLEFVIYVPKNEPLHLTVFAEPPFLSPYNVPIGSFSEAADLVIPIRRGVRIEGRVTSEGEPVSGALIYIKTIEGEKVSEFDGPVAFVSDGSYKFAVDPRPGKVVLQAFQSGYAPSAPVVTTLDRNQVIDFEFEPLNPVTVQASDVDGNPITFASLRFYRDGVLYASTRTLYDGKASTSLPAGRYEVQLFPDGRAGEDAAFFGRQTILLFAQPAATLMLDVPPHASVDTQLVANDMFRFSASVPREFGLGCDDSRLLVNVELVDESGVLARSATRQLSGASGGRYVLDVTSGAGRYKLRVSAIGGVVYESEFFDVAAGLNVALTRVGAGKLAVWEGVIRRHDGTPLLNPLVVPYDASGEPVSGWCPLSVPSVGAFKVLACDKCTYRFFTRSTDDGLGRTITIDDAAPARTADVSLGHPLDVRQVSPDQANLVYGDDDTTDRYDILFIAEGYTNVRETFVDTNGNGVWDGVQHIDSNGNGLYDGFDRIAVYGSAPFPAENTDPKENNEPFTDLNGDGVLSLNDEALFQRNVVDYISALFSNDFFSEYRNAFRVHAALPFSRQVGVDLEGVMHRDTRFGAFAEPDRSGLLNIDGNLIFEYAAEVFPDYDALVVMINQEVPMGRENSFVLATGGVLASNLNDLVGAHEFGHQIARLGDEYSELGLEYVGPSILTANTTALKQLDMIPWGRHVDIYNSIPSKDNSPGTGVFEGGNYYETSVFRPSMNSVMRFMSPGVFNVPSRARLEEAINPFLHGLPGRLSVRPGPARCQRGPKGATNVSWDVNDQGIANVVIRSGSPRGYVIGRGGTTGTLSFSGSKAGRDDLFLIDADSGAVADIESIPSARPLVCAPVPD